MSEMTRICRFKGNDIRFDKSKTYMVNIKEESRTEYEKELLSVDRLGIKTFMTKQIKHYYIVATTQNRIMIYSNMDKFLENWTIIGQEEF